LRILLTGSTGFVGQRLVSNLISRGDDVCALGRTPCKHPNVTNFTVPELDVDAIASALEGQTFDAIIHLAAAGVHPSDRDDFTLMKVNTLLTGAIVTIAKRINVKAVVIAGSSAEYQSVATDKPIKEDGKCETQKLYGASKAAGTILALAQSAVQQIPVAVMRVFNVFGPGEAPHRLLPCLIRDLNSGQPVKLSAGTQVRDFIYIDDVCTGLIAAVDGLINKKLSSGIYNLSTGVGRSVADFARNTSTLLETDPALLQLGALPMRPDDLPYVVGDSTLFQTCSGWRPAFTMEQGILTTIKETATTISTEGAHT
jgi:nucleoside-diphosphate-sugar epimerase